MNVQPDRRELAIKIARRMQRFTVWDLVGESGLAHSTLTEIVKGWESVGLVAQTAKGRGRERRVYQIQPTMALAGTPATEQRFWAVLRILGRVTAAELAAHLDDPESTPEKAQRFLEMCRRANLVHRSGHGKGSTAPPSYQLRHNIGPLAPIEKRVVVIVDPNNGELLKGVDS